MKSGGSSTLLQHQASFVGRSFDNIEIELIITPPQKINQYRTQVTELTRNLEDTRVNVYVRRERVRPSSPPNSLHRYEREMPPVLDSLQTVEMSRGEMMTASVYAYTQVVLQISVILFSPSASLPQVLASAAAVEQNGTRIQHPLMCSHPPTSPIYLGQAGAG